MHGTRASGQRSASVRAAASTSGSRSRSLDCSRSRSGRSRPNCTCLEEPSPYHVLSGSLDQLDATGLLAVPRAGAEEYAWIGVHGAAVLLGGGAIDPRDRERVIEGTLDMVAHGLLTAS